MVTLHYLTALPWTPLSSISLATLRAGDATCWQALCTWRGCARSCAHGARLRAALRRRTTTAWFAGGAERRYAWCWRHVTTRGRSALRALWNIHAAGLWETRAAEMNGEDPGIIMCVDSRAWYGTDGTALLRRRVAVSWTMQAYPRRVTGGRDWRRYLPRATLRCRDRHLRFVLAPSSLTLTVWHTPT